MRNSDKWTPTKAIIKNGLLQPNLSKIYGGSYHTIKIQLYYYQRILTKYSKGDMVDLGCGEVPYYECYKPIATSITCADITENQFTDLTLDLGEKYPFPDNSFDTILYADVINHVADIHNLFSESYRILRKEGSLIVFTPFLYWINEPPYDFHRFTKFGIEYYLTMYNFEKIELFSYGTASDVILDLCFKKLSNRLSFRFLKFLSDELFNKKIANKGTCEIPLGYILVGKKK